MVAVTAGTDAGERIFEIVNQFARGLPAIALDSEREMVAELYLAAGRRAKGSSAYASALAYFSSGRTLLGDHAWARRSDLTLELELNCAECEIIVGELATAEDRLARLAPHVTRLPDQVQVVCLSVLVFFTTGRSERAVEVGGRLELVETPGGGTTVRATLPLEPA